VYDIWYIGYSTSYGIKKVHITLHIIHNIVCRMYIYIYYCTLHINCKISNSYQISIIIHYYSRKISTFQKSNVKPFRPRDLETCFPTRSVAIFETTRSRIPSQWHCRWTTGFWGTTSWRGISTVPNHTGCDHISQWLSTLFHGHFRNRFIGGAYHKADF
jgi:hypothetical protein